MKITFKKLEEMGVVKLPLSWQENDGPNCVCGIYDIEQTELDLTKLFELVDAENIIDSFEGSIISLDGEQKQLIVEAIIKQLPNCLKEDNELE